jgi:MoaA/NifB/PqqE/SkfB family radical SAM enzyme
MTDWALENLLSRYDILYLNKLKCFFESPIDHLYNELAAIKRKSYNTDQRIVLVDTLPPDKNKQYFFNYLQKIITHLDITNCFVMVVTVDSDVVEYLNFARIKYSQDQTNIQVEQLALTNEVVTAFTNFNIPDTMCINPWISLEIGLQGQITPCCVYKESLDNKSINDFSLLTIINDNSQIELKQQFLQGNQPLGCQKCWQDETNGKVSKRLRDNYVFREKLFGIDYNNIGSTELISLDIKLKNTCNLSCRICSPIASSKLKSEVAQHPESYPQWASLKNIKTEWTDDPSSNFWKDIETIGNNLEYVTFTGGEPLLDKSHARMLKYFVDNKRSGQISLHYNTNGTVYANHLIPLWNKFRYVELSFSLDNIESKFEYERHGAVWTDVIDNINQYKKLNPEIYRFNVFSVVTALNILDSYALFQFCKNSQLPIAFDLLDSPQELNVGLFNHKQKDYISTKLLEIHDQEFHNIIEPIINSMNTRAIQCNPTSMINYLQTIDKIRRQDFKTTYTELSNILNQE